MGWTAHAGATVEDAAGIQHRLTQPVAPAGGQGEVWKTEAESIAVKISNRANATIADRIAAVARLDVHDLDVAAPRIPLQPPAVGYAMNLVTGMIAIGELGPVGQDPFCHPSPTGSIADWFERTGGIRKRLRALASLADTLNELHSRGLVYADLNGGNALVSARPDRYRVILIDLDNLQHADEEPARFYRPEFAPPEFSETGATQAGDRFAIVAMAWSLLTTKNPFYGTALDQRSVADLSTSVSWALLAPMVGSQARPGNEAIGLEAGRVVPPRLHRLAVLSLETTEPQRRAPASQLATAARTGSAAIVDCSCGWQNFINADDCYRCDSPLDSHEVIEVLDALGCAHALSAVALRPESPVELDRASLGLPGSRATPALRLRLDGTSVLAESLTDDVTTAVGDELTEINRRDRSPLRMRIRAR